MYPKNCWYVAAHAHEVTGQLFARTLLDQPVIFWRTPEDGIAALEDRCPHRLVPLSTGEIVDGTVRCGYHGLRFGADGVCAHVPGQDRAPKTPRVKTFPALERHGLIWIWLGAEDLADPDLVPDLHWLDAPGWTATTGTLHFKCDYRLINDNLLDLSHETFIHKHTIGNDSVADSPAVTDVVDKRVVRVHREMPDIEPPPFFSLSQGHDGRINRWQIAIYMAPGFNMTEVGFHSVESDRVQDHYMMRPIHIITPETEHSCHYIWAVARNFRLDDDELDSGLWTAIDHTFKEDRELLEIQDARLQAEGMPKVPQLAVKLDTGPLAGRRLLDAMIRKEQEDPRYCAPPIPLADDEVVTMPFAAAAE